MKHLSYQSLPGDSNIFDFNTLGQTFFILWFTDVFGLYSKSGFGTTIKKNFVDVRLTFAVNALIKQEKAYFYT